MWWNTNLTSKYPWPRWTLKCFDDPHSLKCYDTWISDGWIVLEKYLGGVFMLEKVGYWLWATRFQEPMQFRDVLSHCHLLINKIWVSTTAAELVLPTSSYAPHYDGHGPSEVVSPLQHFLCKCLGHVVFAMAIGKWDSVCFLSWVEVMTVSLPIGERISS